MVPSDQPAAFPVIEAQLLPGEELLWVGRPKQGFALRALDLWVLPFMLCWTSFVIYTTYLMAVQEGTLSSIVSSIPFLLMGALFLVGRPTFDAMLRARTFYGLTDRRAILASNWLRRKVRSVYLRDLQELQYTHRSDGTGTIEFFTDLGGFNRLRTIGFNRSSAWWPFSPDIIPPAFEMISSAREVERLILEARDKAQAAAGGSIRGLADETR